MQTLDFKLYDDLEASTAEKTDSEGKIIPITSEEKEFLLSGIKECDVARQEMVYAIIKKHWITNNPTVDFRAIPCGVKLNKASKIPTLTIDKLPPRAVRLVIAYLKRGEEDRMDVDVGLGAF